MRNEILRFEPIRNLRIDHSFSQQIAEILNVRQNTDSQYEIWVSNYPLNAVIKLAHFYNTSTDYIGNLTDVSAPYPRSKV